MHWTALACCTLSYSRIQCPPSGLSQLYILMSWVLHHNIHVYYSRVPVLPRPCINLRISCPPVGTSKLEIAYGTVLGALQNALLSAQNSPSGTEACAQAVPSVMESSPALNRTPRKTLPLDLTHTCRICCPAAATSTEVAVSAESAPMSCLQMYMMLKDLPHRRRPRRKS